MSRCAPHTRFRLPRLLSALAALTAAVATSLMAAVGLTAQEMAAAFRVDPASVTMASPLSARIPQVLTALEASEGQSFPALTWRAAASPKASPAPGWPSPAPDTFRPPTASSILGGTLGSAVGVAGGALVGYSMRSCSSGEWLCGMGEAMVGALAGSVVGSTMGANIAARRGGATPTFRSTVLAGMAGVLTGALGSALGAQVDPDGGFGALLGWSLGQGIVTGITAAKHR